MSEEEIEALERLRMYYGSQRALADVLGVSEVSVSKWMKKGMVPPRRALEIELITGGDIRAVELYSMEGLDNE